MLTVLVGYSQSLLLGSVENSSSSDRTALNRLKTHGTDPKKKVSLTAAALSLLVSPPFFCCVCGGSITAVRLCRVVRTLQVTRERSPKTNHPN
ncbi:hypothetical protein RUM43_011831 [Polyplax serrata]|uniref:Uncharacterized protein n=1 Tax=Polyplax serrata TaxID=468196 RepID=A0AAN8PIR0_POLSC